MATRKGLEPSTSSVTGWHSNRLNYRAIYEIGGNNRARTCDPLLVRQMLSQLSYAPVCRPCRDDLFIISWLHENVNRVFQLFSNIFSEICKKEEHALCMPLRMG